MKKMKNFNAVDEVYSLNGEANTARNGKHVEIVEDEKAQIAFIYDDEDEAEDETSDETIFIDLENEAEGNMPPEGNMPAHGNNPHDEAEDISEDDVYIIVQKPTSCRKKIKKINIKDINKFLATGTMLFLSIVTLIAAIATTCYCQQEGLESVYNDILHLKYSVQYGFGNTALVGCLLICCLSLFLMGNSINWLFKSLLKINEVGLKKAMDNIHEYALEIATNIQKSVTNAIKLAFATGIVYFVWNFLTEI